MANIHPLAGQKANMANSLTRAQVATIYNNLLYWNKGASNPVKNGTSGHRGENGKGFNRLHISAMTQALCDIRKERGTFGPDMDANMIKRIMNMKLGPIIMGKDVRYVSDLAQTTACEIFAGNGIPVIIQKNNGYTPTPVVSNWIIDMNNKGMNCEGVVITASHNPPEEGGYKSNGYNGGPNTRTAQIDEIANYHMENITKIRSMDYYEALRKGLIIENDLMTPYLNDLIDVVDMDIIKGGRFAVSPLGGSACGYYNAINGFYGTNIKEIFGEPDPEAKNRTYDWDGKLRGDPSSPYVMMAIKGYREQLGVPAILANDNDADRFGGEDSTGILNPNHVLCVLFNYLAKERGFPASMGIGRTIGTTHMLDLIAADYKRPSYEVNVGFKWYVDGLISGKYVLAGEESAGLSFPRRDGSVWVTEKDGIATNLLIMEIMARTGMDIGTLYGLLVSKYGPYQYERVDMPADAKKKEQLAFLSKNPDEVHRMLDGKMIAGRKIERMVIGDGVKVVLDDGTWVLKRASGTEPIIKDYREQRGDNFDTVRKASEELDHYLGL